MENDKIEKFKCDILGEIGWPESLTYPKHNPKIFYRAPYDVTLSRTKNHHHILGFSVLCESQSEETW